MDFVALENVGKKLFEQFPIVKRSCKRVYQLSMYAVSREKFKLEGEVTRISPNDEYEYFYGYYDKSPWDKTDRYMLCIRVKQAYKSVAPQEAGEVIIIDTKENNKVIKIASTDSWNVQQGCMAQWLGPDYSEKIIYNDFRDGEYCSVIFNVRLNKEERVLQRPVYDVSKDGRFALSLDFSRLHRLRKGYGYSNLPDYTKKELCPNKACIWKVSLETGKAEELLKYTDFAAFETNETMTDAEHKVNHIMISPNGKRFMVLHRWFQNGRKNTRLVTVNCDGSDMYNLSDDVFVSHCYWKNDNEILSFLRKKETGDHYYLMKDKTREYKMFWPELNTDGHCSYSPDGKLIITDTYPNRKRLAYVYICNENGQVKKIASVFAPFRYDNDVRCDLHPRWNNFGDRVCIDSVHEGKRGLYVVSVGICTDKKDSVNIPKTIHYCWFGGKEKPEIVKKCIETWKVKLPEYEIKEWNEKNFDVSKSCQYVKDAFSAGKWAFVSDYVRLYALYNFGGIYLDTDVEVVKSLDEFLANDTFMGGESRHTLTTATIGSISKQKWIEELLKIYEETNFINADGSYNVVPNTKLIQNYLENNYNYKVSENIIELAKGFKVYPMEYFSPINCYTGVKKITNNTHTIHLYDNSWKSDKEKLKRRVMQLVTRVIGEDIRACVVRIIKK